MIARSALTYQPSITSNHAPRNARPRSGSSAAFQPDRARTIFQGLTQPAAPPRNEEHSTTTDSFNGSILVTPTPRQDAVSKRSRTRACDASRSRGSHCRSPADRANGFRPRPTASRHNRKVGIKGGPSRAPCGCLRYFKRRSRFRTTSADEPIAHQGVDWSSCQDSSTLDMSRVTLPHTACVVLGLMSVRPRAGHELAGYAQGSLGNFSPVTRSHVYSELDRLCRLGLLEATEVRQERVPTKSRVRDHRRG